MKNTDDRYWNLELDRGTGWAIIRFLPPYPGEAFPWVHHKNAGKLIYISNILVVNDPKHSENNGRVFLFKYDRELFHILGDVTDPLFDEEPRDPFDTEDGVNVKLGYVAGTNKSRADNPSAIGDKDQIASVLKGRFPLLDIEGFIMDDLTINPSEKAKRITELIRLLGTELDGVDPSWILDVLTTTPSRSRFSTGPAARLALIEEVNFLLNSTYKKIASTSISESRQ
jgi:hypothetical protein